MKELAKQEKFELASPADVDRFSFILKQYIVQNKLSTEIQGKTYVYSDGWKFAGISFGLSPIVEEPVNISEGKLAYVFYQMKQPYGGGKQYEAAYCITSVPKLIEGLKKDKKTVRSSEIEVRKFKCNCDIINLA